MHSQSLPYPPREAFYAHRFTRLLFKSCAAQAIGQDAVLLVIHIAHTEDAARYQGPVRFWNSQLNEVLGFRSPKSLNNARSKAVQAGWLVYSRKNDRSDGLYFTTIPKHVLAFDDEPIEPVPVSAPSTESIPLSVPSTEQEAEQESYALRNRKVTGNDPPPNPVPNPNPNPIDDDASDLSIWVDWWNGLAKKGMVHAGVKKTSTLEKKFKAAMKNDELRDLLNREEIEKQIRQSEFVRKSWFTLAKLLGSKNKSGDLILECLLNGAYAEQFGSQVNLSSGVKYSGTEVNHVL
ncbi:hypothetical protein SH449x_001713 [Pirellulaceae bacterium SH449]